MLFVWWGFHSADIFLVGFSEDWNNSKLKSGFSNDEHTKVLSARIHISIYLLII